MRSALDVLALALRTAQAGLAQRARAMAAADDPLRLALPPLPAAPPVTPAADALAAYAALYLHAELEEARVLPAVEALAERRYRLALQDRNTIGRLERFFLSARDHPARSERAVIFGRLFGMGEGRGDDARLDFLQRLLRLATAAVRADLERSRLAGQPGLASQAAWQAAAQDLLAVVAAQPGAWLVQSARRIHARSLQAFDILGDAGLMRWLLSRSPWESLTKLLPEEGALQRDAAARRGAAGQALLRALPAAATSLPDAETVQAAVRWLVASGLPVPQATMLPPPSSAIGVPETAFEVSA
ncbi:hypothetical protein H8N03_16235 [Ramlibacter sp. USB13]|uniref:Uncharacterized protein n=1 Tax=Ramlibacter cellulosilyticus TaxID=2764187 RepID=A0A923SCP8_9BURK|nr:hypothetical protein [Ramlibacter cellulosilyticus]MBC5784498.1 hypothetical protein [Ramlibacter cellulosilyticus]